MVAVTAAEVVVLVIIIIEVAVMGQMAVEEEEEEEEGLVPRIPDFPRFEDGERLKKKQFSPPRIFK